MRIELNEQAYLDEFADGDQPALVEYLAEREIFERTLLIPFPYTPAHADGWIEECRRMAEQDGEPTQFAIRLAHADEATGAAAGTAIGGGGFHGLEIGKSHRAELGYWLAKPFWNRGIGSAVVRVLTEIGFRHFRLAKLSAHVYAWNEASVRILEKNGYQVEGHLRRHYLKDGVFHDAKLLARLRD